MTKITPVVCGVIPPHILTNVAGQGDEETSGLARSTLEQMRSFATQRRRTLLANPEPAEGEAVPPRKRRYVYDAQHQERLPGKLVMSEHKSRSRDVEADEAFDGSGDTYDFFADVFGRQSVDGRGLRLDSSIHFAKRFDNAMWNGHQMVYGDGDGRLFNRFTAALDVIGHELTHGVTQFSAALGYSGQTGALNEHLSDAFGIMVKQYKLGQSALESDWIIGEGLFTPEVSGRGVRSMAAPGTAYDDPLLGRDPQPSHMRGYVKTPEDNGGVHINSGIPNHAFYLAAIAIGGNTWEKLGKIWYRTLTRRLKPNARFLDFARATTEVAGELCGAGSREQYYVADAWAAVGLTVPLFACNRSHFTRPAPSQRAAAAVSVSKSKWRNRPLKA